MDLLLSLVVKNKLDICDIMISELVDQYLGTMEEMRRQEMEPASEFLEMAARLVYMKTVSLLPKHEEAEELKRELSGQLLEYQACKRAAERLASMFSFDFLVREPQQTEPDRTYRRRHSPQELLAAYRSAVGRGKRLLPPSPREFSGIVSHRIVSVTSRIIGILRRLRSSGRAQYAGLFVECTERSELVATFLAVLELIKGRRIRLEGEDGKTVKLISGGEKFGN